MQEPGRTWFGVASLHGLTVAGSRRRMQADLAVYVSRMLILALGLMLFAWLAGPHREPFDCQVTRLSKAEATGRLQAFSRRSELRMTDVSIALGATEV